MLVPKWKFDFHEKGRRSATPIALLKAVFQSTALRVLLLSAIAWIVAFNLFKHVLFWREPHSAFFDADKGTYDLVYSAERINEGADFLAKASNDASWTPTHSTAPVICAAVATVKRQINYLNDTIGTMMATLTPEERSAVEVRLTFVSTHPETHPDWNEPWMNLVDFKGGYNLSDDETLENLKMWEADDQYIQRKGVWDYIYLLEDCLERSDAPYIAVFEDDIVFAEGWLSKTMKALADLREQSTDWLYLRLFYTEQYHVFWNNKDFWHSHHYLAYGIGGALTIVALSLLRGLSRNAQRGLSYLTILVLACIVVPMFIRLAFLIPKHSLIVRPGLHRMDAACCTQALVFPRSQVPDVMGYLREKQRGQTDLFIEKYANELGMARYAVEPQQVQHIGVKSSRGVNGKTTWAYLFETYNKDKLKKQHQELTHWDIWRAQDDGQAGGG